MNKSSSNTSPIINVDFSGGDWSTHPIIEWLISHKKSFLWGFLIVLGCLILAYRLVAMRTLNAETDFFHAQKAFTQFQKEGISQNPSASTDLEELKDIMQRHSELKPKYEGPLAQTLLIAGETNQAQIFADDIFKRTKVDRLQFYQDYSRISLLMGEGRYTEALQQAQQLRLNLDQLSEQENPILYVFNLIRLAILYQQTDQIQKELQTWEELLNQPHRIDALLVANQVFKMGQASLNQYIEERKKTLSP